MRARAPDEGQIMGELRSDSSMGWRFYRRIKLLPGVKVNLSKRGLTAFGRLADLSAIAKQVELSTSTSGPASGFFQPRRFRYSFQSVTVPAAVVVAQKGEVEAVVEEEVVEKVEALIPVRWPNQRFRTRPVRGQS